VARAYAPHAPAPDAPANAAAAPDTPAAPAAPLIAAPEPPAFTIDTTGMTAAIEAYRKGDLAAGDLAARGASNPDVRLALEWAALRLQPRPAGFERIARFIEANPSWPATNWLRMRAEQGLYADRIAPARAAQWLAKHGAHSPTGKMVQARLLLAEGKRAQARAIIVSLWRNEDTGGWAESALLKEFGSLLEAADHRHRSDRLFYREKYSASHAAAARAGKEFLELSAARIAVARGAEPAKAGAKLSTAQRKEPSWTFAQAHRLRNAKKFADAGKLLANIELDAEALIVPREWWEERRIVARNLLDAGDAASAYAIASAHRGNGGEDHVDGAFYAGWLALRFLDDPQKALAHFAEALEAAATPISRARAAYWKARAAERSEYPQDADRLYAIAASHSSAYYGQLARGRLGMSAIPVRAALRIAEGDERIPAVRAVEALFACGAKDLALPLAIFIAHTNDDPAQIAALADVVRRAKDARGVLMVGKLASQRGVELDDVAFPVFGIPRYTPLRDSAAAPLVYSIARQESAFQANAISHAGARGLMQMMPATARRTAQNMKVPFDLNRLISDPAFNAQLGAAHLGELMAEYPGSMIMVFAAYNAGGRRVREWVRAYGDPREPGVDPIDWVERIPISETRNYVQRVTENLGVYRARMQSADTPDMPQRDLRAYASRN
ncbi:MAG: lytic transglycosylase domain-containing protein, partial [Alphaproteobacteria bacterium]|nr:lytic transglycosylase domain-containing protein [Alphaproteobacteria bacterium]